LLLAVFGGQYLFSRQALLARKDGGLTDIPNVLQYKYENEDFMITTSGVASPSSLTILLIEDDVGHAELYRRCILSALHGTNVTFLHEKTLRGGIERCRQDSIDIVFLDLGLQESTGISTLHQFLDHEIEIPVIVLTALADMELGMNAIQVGAQDYLVKERVDPEAITKATLFALSRAEHLAQLNQKIEDLSNFAAVASHDLRAPLSRALSAAMLIEEAFAESGVHTSKEVQEDLKIVQTQLQEGLLLIGKILRFARSGAEGLRLTAFSLLDMIDNVQDALGLREKDSSVSLVLPDELSLIGDRELIREVFLNLIGNAVKYGPSDRKTAIVVRWDEDDTHWIISISDNGEGISQEKKRSIFRPFVRASSEHQSQSTGLGLSICQRIVEAHEGTIDVDSTEGEGTTFTFTLPKLYST
jgi:signal transduction histidine kinase